MLTCYVKCGESMRNSEVPINVVTAKAAIKSHNDLYDSLISLSVDLRESEFRNVRFSII